MLHQKCRVFIMWYLFGKLAEGVTIDEFLVNFPTVGREQLIQPLRLASLLAEAKFHENSVARSSHPGR